MCDAVKNILLYFVLFKAFYICGEAIRTEGTGGAREAFVLLNHCLDLVEAAEEDAAHLIDYNDFGIIYILFSVIVLLLCRRKFVLKHSVPTFRHAKILAYE